MPRAANAYKKTGPAIAPGDEEHDAGAAAQQTVRWVPAAGAPPATNSPAAVRSVFEAGQAAKPKRAPRSFLDVNTVQIETDVPLPPVATGVTGLYKDLWARIPVGGMVKLTPKQASGLAAHCKKAGEKYAIRTLGDNVKGVWRLA